jgi:hypothetical protein
MAELLAKEPNASNVLVRESRSDPMDSIHEGMEDVGPNRRRDVVRLS